jgi:hypothetical protein
MNIYFDTASSNIVLGNKLTGTSDGTMEAVEFASNKIGIRYKSSALFEVVVKWDAVLKEDDTRAGADLSEVISYLTSQFEQKSSSYTDGGVVQTVNLTGLQQSISLTALNIAALKNYTVQNISTGKEVSVVVLRNNGTLIVQSNIDLTGLRITLIGN